MNRSLCSMCALTVIVVAAVVESGQPAYADLGPMFCNVTQKFSGEMVDFVPVKGESLGNGKIKTEARIISVVALDYDSTNQRGSQLKTLGPVDIGPNCIVKGRSAKSGWVSYDTVARFDEKSPVLDLIGVSFWVNEGGQNWWSFSIEKVLRQDNGQSVPYSTGIEKQSKGGNLPYVSVYGHKMYPRSLVLNGIVFVGK